MNLHDVQLAANLSNWTLCGVDSVTTDQTIGKLRSEGNMEASAYQGWKNSKRFMNMPYDSVKLKFRQTPEPDILKQLERHLR